MVIKKKDKIGSKVKSNETIREVVRTEMLNVVTEVIIPALDQVYSAIDGTDKNLNRKLDDFMAKTENNFSDVKRQINDLRMDTPSREEFKKHDHRIQRLENELGFA